MTDQKDPPRDPREAYMLCCETLSAAIADLVERRRRLAEEHKRYGMPPFPPMPAWAAGVPPSSGDVAISRVSAALAALTGAGTESR